VGQRFVDSAGHDGGASGGQFAVAVLLDGEA
jgi:hypothetical protein